MGYIKAIAKISNPENPAELRAIELLVDTGATFTMLPKRILHELNIEPDAKFRVKTADGRAIEREGTQAYIEIEGRGYKVPILFGEEGDASILGITTLEILGLEADPITGKLKPAEYLLL